jgi:hypothetical protein
MGEKDLNKRFVPLMFVAGKLSQNKNGQFYTKVTTSSKKLFPEQAFP